MSRRRQEPVDAAFNAIAALTDEQYARLQERLAGWIIGKNGSIPAAEPKIRKPRKTKPAEVPAA